MKCFKISFQVLMALFLVFGTLGVSSTGATVVKADSTALTLPYSQNWTNTSLITVNDDWSGVSGIVGYRGDGLTTANDVNAQTVLIDDNPGVVTVFANQPSGSTGSGGIMEFDGIANPVIAMQGSGTADAPYLLINLNTAGNQNISVSYKVRDVDGSADNSSQQVALHFRVGGSGAFTNVPDAYIADATTGGTATQETSVSATLPNEANNQPLVQLRIMTTNAAGNDEWVGIDDIAVTGTPIVGDVAPSVVSTTPSNGSTALKSDNIVVTFSEPVTVADGWYSISCDTSGLHIASMADADPVYTLDPAIDFTSGETCTVTIDHAKVSDKDLDDATADLMVADYVFSFSIAESCGDTFTPIYAIQGNGANSPLVGQDISTEGVVTADLQTTKKGFYIQTPSTEVDADPLTSEGLFVYTGSTPLTLTVGNRVRVIGKVVEFSGLTEISPVTTVVNCGASGETVLPVELSLPFTDTNAANLEPVENMLVHFVQPLVINEYYNFDRYGEIVLGSKRLDNPTNVVAPGAPAIALQAANNLDKITLDDGVSAQNPEFLPHPNGGRFCQGTLVGTADCPVANIFRGGDEVSNLTAVVDYVAGGWKLVKTQPATYFAANPRTSAPDLVAGELRISSINTLNYFLSTGSICGPLGDQGCRGAENAEELNRQRTKTIATVIGMASDITGLLELENDNPTATTASGPDYAIKDIVAGLNSVAGDGTYDYIRTGAIGGDAIKAGIVYKPARVTPVGNPAYLTSSVDPDFIDTCNRPVLAQTFQDLATGQKFTLAVNHLKSKGSACEALNDADTGDGQGNANLTRTMAAEAQVKWLEADPTETDSEMYLIMGDLNSYAMEDPITAIKAGADGVAGTTDDYFDLVQRFRELFHYPNSYGYVFDGQAGYLDGALANRLMASYVLDCKEWHINSDEADALDYNTNFRGTAQKALWQPDTYRSSDHDPILVSLMLNHDPAPVDDAYNAYKNRVLTVDAAHGVLANDTDANIYDKISASILTQPVNGLVVMQPDGSFTYTPKQNFVGVDTFQYTMHAEPGLMSAYANTATVTITVTDVNNAPVAVDDFYDTNQDTTLVVSAADGVLKNDSDIDLDNMTVTLLSGTAHGALTLMGDGSFTYVPAPGFFGTDTFTYQLVTYPSLALAEGWTDEATVTITVHEVVPPTYYLYLPLITK